jgi:hypothetical protein
MKNSSLRAQAPITAAQRGQIVQWVIIGGRTSAEVAASCGLPRRLIDVWVADFRRHGMASLRQEPSCTVTAEIIQLAICRPLRAVWHRVSTGLRRVFATEPATRPLPLRRSIEDGPR